MILLVKRYLENAQDAGRIFALRVTRGRNLSSVNCAWSSCVPRAKRSRVSFALSAIPVAVTLVPCLPSVQCARYKNASGAVISMSAGFVLNKAVLIMELNVARDVIQVIATTVRMNMSNSASYVTNIIALMTVTTVCIDDKTKICQIRSVLLLLYTPNRVSFRRIDEPVPSALQFQVRNNVFLLLYLLDCVGDTAQWCTQSLHLH